MLALAILSGVAMDRSSRCNSTMVRSEPHSDVILQIPKATTVPVISAGALARTNVNIDFTAPNVHWKENKS